MFFKFFVGDISSFDDRFRYITRHAFDLVQKTSERAGYFGQLFWSDDDERECSEENHVCEA